MPLSFDEIVDVLKYAGHHTHHESGELTDHARAVANECKDTYTQSVTLIPALNKSWERNTPECEFCGLPAVCYELFAEQTPVCHRCASSPKGLLEKPAHVTLTNDPPTGKAPPSFT